MPLLAVLLQDVVVAMRSLYPQGVDVVYEGVGGRLREQLLTCLAPGGRLLQVGGFVRLGVDTLHTHCT